MKFKYIQLLCAVLLFACFGTWWASAADVAKGASGPLRVLVVSDIADFRSSLAATLSKRGAAANAAAALDEAKLLNADVLVIHSSVFQAQDDHRAALEAFAKRGGGIVALNGAIAMGDTQWLKPLIGGAWTADSNKFASRMMIYVAESQHPIVSTASSFDVDDDTVTGLDIDAAATVMASASVPTAMKGYSGPSRQNSAQPQMWAYEAPAANGAKASRAFVSLQGSATTLKHPSYRTFVMRAIAWTAKRGKLDEFCLPAEVAALRYPLDGPVRAEDAAKQFKVHPGFTVTALASEPMINKPIAVHWDGRGRLWLAESPEYPTGRRPATHEPWKETGVLAHGKYERPATDKISILSAPNAQGKFTKKTVFYTGLELVTAFCLYKDGVIALHKDDIVFIRDTDGDDKADKVERLYTGFNPGDTHFIGNHFIVGMDGWIYADMGGGDEVRNPVTNEVLGRVSSGLFRFKPDGSAIEQISSKGGNGFGAEVTSDFELFFGQATSGDPVQHVVLPEKILAQGSSGRAFTAHSVIDGRKVVVPKLQERSMLMAIDVIGGYSASCASLVYEGGAWPAEWNNSVFCTEPLVNIIHHEIMEPKGPTFTGNMVRPDAEFLYSPDYWFRPIEVALGPDGALYILDFYSPVIAHNDAHFKEHGKAGASARPDRGHYFGRMYRVQYDKAKKLPIPALTRASSAKELAAAFSHPNRTVRFNAQRILMEKDPKEIAGAVTGLAESSTFAPARILALWSLQRIGQLPAPMLAAALSAGDAGIRKNAALIAEVTNGGGVTNELKAGLRDSDPRVRLAVLRAMTTAPLDDATTNALFELFPTLTDDWTKAAVVAAAASNPVTAVRQALQSKQAGELQAFATPIVNQLVVKKDSKNFGELVQAAAAAPAAADPLKVAIVTAAVKLETPPPASAALTGALRTFMESSNAELNTAVLPLAATWDASGALRPEVVRRAGLLMAQANDTKLPDASREQVIGILMGVRSVSPDVMPALQKLLEGRNSDKLKQRVITALTSTGDDAAGRAIIDVFDRLSTPSQKAAFTALIKRNQWTDAFLTAVEQKKISIASLDTSMVSNLRMSSSPEVVARADKLLQASFKVSKDKDALIAKLLPEVSKPGDAVKGKQMFAGMCGMCHKVDDIGTEIGPQLAGIGIHGPQSMLIHIVDPNRQIDGGYDTWNIETTDGETESGIVVRENASQVVLARASGTIEIPMAKILSRTNTHRSLMPEGLEAIGAPALRDIIAFLSGGDGSRMRVLSLANAFTGNTQLVFRRNDANGRYETLNLSAKGIVKVSDIPFDVADAARLGNNAIVLKGNVPGTSIGLLPKSVEVPVGYAASKFYFLGGISASGGQPNAAGSTAMTVTVVFEDGKKQTVELRHGDVFADYKSEVNVPGSKRADGLVNWGGQVRWFTIPVSGNAVVSKLILESPGDGAAPITLAITAELGGGSGASHAAAH